MLKTAEKVVDASLQLKTAKESLAKIQSQLFMTKKATLRSVVKTIPPSFVNLNALSIKCSRILLIFFSSPIKPEGIAGSISDCKKVQDLENQYMTCLEQISLLEKQVSPTSSQKLSNLFLSFIIIL